MPEIKALKALVAATMRILVRRRFIATPYHTARTTAATASFA
jgi:hypothetical protein